jgi:hypothetical protein
MMTVLQDLEVRFVGRAEIGAARDQDRVPGTWPRASTALWSSLWYTTDPSSGTSLPRVTGQPRRLRRAYAATTQRSFARRMSVQF